MGVKDYDLNPDNNTQINGINIAEGCPPSGINDAIRQMMADVKADKAAQDTATATAQSAADAAKSAADAAKSAADASVKTVNGTAPDAAGDVKVGGKNVGDEWHSFTGKIPAGGVPYCGQTVTRVTYADLWAYVQDKGLVKTETEWQSLNTSQNGNVPFYSSGDGSTTFRMPKVVGYIKGASSLDGVGTYTAEGLPNIKAGIKQNKDGYGALPTPYTSPEMLTGAMHFTENKTYTSPSATNNPTIGSPFELDASLASSIYGNSSHVTPETITVLFGVYAYGELTATGSTTTDALATGLANVESGLANKLDNDTLHIVKTWKSGGSWYRKWSDGFIEQGGEKSFSSGAVNRTVTTSLNTSFSSTLYIVTTQATQTASDYYQNATEVISRSKSNFVMQFGFGEAGSVMWYACGY